MNRRSLALVVIGRNPGTDLSRLLAAARPYGFDEIIFADSASVDGSGDVARAHGARVVRVPPSEPGAAAARAAGTLAVTESEWILYLDSDMVPDLGALRRIHEVLEQTKPNVAGVVAQMRDRYTDGSSRVRHMHERSGDRASTFGGAVTLRRRAVLEAGNWNPLVMANEELDLHARLRAGGYHVVFEDVILVDHFTPLQRGTEKLAVLLNWRGRAGYRYGALGLALRSCLTRGAAWHLVTLSPEPFLAVPVTLFAVGLAIAGFVWASLALFSVLWAWVIWRRGWRYLAPSYLLFPQVFVGVMRYGRPR